MAAWPEGSPLRRPTGALVEVSAWLLYALLAEPNVSRPLVLT
jgi:hypothetical protein